MTIKKIKAISQKNVDAPRNFKLKRNMILNKDITLMIALFLMLAFLLSCGTEPDDNGEIEINPNIVKIIDCCDDRTIPGNYFLGNFFDNQVITTGPISRLELNSDFEIVSNEDVWREIIEQFEDPFGTGFYITFNNQNEELIFVKSSYGDASSGSLFSYYLNTKEIKELRDSSFNISSAIYWHGDDSKLAYYSYGNDDGLEAGYYLHNKATDTDSLLLAHRSPMGPSEMLNGFDLSPDNRKLLIPDVRATPSEVLSPQIVEYDLQTQQADTFDVAFDLSFVRIGLWLRYSPDGARILYSNFPFGSFTETTNDDSEMGIIEVATGEKRILDVNTNPAGSQRSVQMAPTWSPDGQHILYGSAPLVMPSGIKSTYSLYLLKNVGVPRNFK